MSLEDQIKNALASRWPHFPFTTTPAPGGSTHLAPLLIEEVAVEVVRVISETTQPYKATWKDHGTFAKVECTCGWEGEIYRHIFVDYMPKAEEAVRLHLEWHAAKITSEV